jgi:hypothetical protein
MLKRMVGDYTWLKIADDLLSHTIRTDLTKQLGWAEILGYELYGAANKTLFV